MQADRDGQADDAALELLAEASWWLGRANECILVRYDRLGDRTNAAQIAPAAVGGPPAAGAPGDRRELAAPGRATARRPGGVCRARLPRPVPRRAVTPCRRARSCPDPAHPRSGHRRTPGSRQPHRRRRSGDRQGDHPGRIAGRGPGRDGRGHARCQRGRLGAYTTGKIYCCMMSACDELGDLDRLTEWTQIGATWSAEQGVSCSPACRSTTPSCSPISGGGMTPSVKLSGPRRSFARSAGSSASPT